MIILPRQARDKHRENSKKARFAAATASQVSETRHCSPLSLYKTTICQDRLGTSIRKISKKLRFTEYLGMPLLDVHSIAAVRTFRMELVTIINYEAWDTAPGAPPELPVVSFTGGRANHSLDGITLLNAGNIAGKPGEIY